MGYVVIAGIEGWGGHTFTVHVQRVDGVPKVDDLRIQAPPGQPIRTGRTVPYGELARIAASGSTGQLDVRTWLADVGGPLYSINDRPRGGSREFSEQVAEVFTSARAEGLSGWRAVVLAFGLDTPSTPEPTARRHAERLIEEARAKFGVLPLPQPRKPRKGK